METPPLVTPTNQRVLSVFSSGNTLCLSPFRDRSTQAAPVNRVRSPLSHGELKPALRSPPRVLPDPINRSILPGQNRRASLPRSLRHRAIRYGATFQAAPRQRTRRTPPCSLSTAFARRSTLKGNEPNCEPGTLRGHAAFSGRCPFTGRSNQTVPVLPNKPREDGA
jgi:hypothetical protein